MPTSQEWVTIYTLIVTNIFGGIAAAFQFWSNRKLAAEAREVKEKQTREQEITQAYSQLLEMCEKRVATAEKREADSNHRTDMCVSGLSEQTTTIGKVGSALGVLVDEVKRSNANYESVVREFVRPARSR